MKRNKYSFRSSLAARSGIKGGVQWNRVSCIKCSGENDHSHQCFGKNTQSSVYNLVIAAISELQGTCTNFTARCIPGSVRWFGPLSVCK